MNSAEQAPEWGSFPNDQVPHPAGVLAFSEQARSDWLHLSGHLITVYQRCLTCMQPRVEPAVRASAAQAAVETALQGNAAALALIGTAASGVVNRSLLEQEYPWLEIGRAYAAAFTAAGFVTLQAPGASSRLAFLAAELTCLALRAAETLAHGVGLLLGTHQSGPMAQVCAYVGTLEGQADTLLRWFLTTPPRSSGNGRQQDAADSSSAECQALLVQLAEDRFNLAVVGQFKRGKSTLMNAILGCDLLLTGLLPLTSAITMLCYGSTERVVLRREGWTLEQEVLLAQLTDYITERGNPGNERGLLLSQVIERSPEQAAEALAALLADTATCAACRLVRETIAEQVEQLLAHLATEEGRADYSISVWLCLPHLQVALAHLEHRSDGANEYGTIAEPLLCEQVRRLAELAEDLRSYALKRDALRRRLLHQEEADAWRRVLVQVVGERAARRSADGRCRNGLETLSKQERAGSHDVPEYPL